MHFSIRDRFRVSAPGTSALLGLVMLLATAEPAHAHVSYTGRIFGTWDNSGGSWSVTGNSGTVADGAVTIGGTNLSSTFGWADATDADWGDSHRGRFFRVTLNQAGRVTLSVTGGGLSSVSYAGTGTRLLPGVSIFSGTAASATHDGAVSTINFLTTTFGTSAGTGLGGSGKEGAFNALGNWSIGNDDGTVSSLAYIGHMADGTSANYGNAAGILGDGTADGFVTGSFDLSPGTYSIFIGGADYAAGGLNYGVPAVYPSYGFSASLAVAPVPEPSTWALAAIGGAGAAWWSGRRRRSGSASAKALA